MCSLADDVGERSGREVNFSSLAKDESIFSVAPEVHVGNLWRTPFISACWS